MRNTGPARVEDELASLSIGKAARLLRRREISPLDLVEAALARIEKLNPALDAFLTVTAERARRDARLAERAFKRGRRGSTPGPLHGIPVALKDNIWTRGVRTTAGSRILGHFVPSRDSEVARRLARARAILVGKTNLHEFAYGISNENPHYGPVRNPWARDRISGGSSGGSAAAVATGMCFASVGTDTGGSIRIPSALCGIAGLKPTYGLVSVERIVPLSLSLDHAGPMARSVEDLCMVLEAIAGEYPKGAARPDVRRLARNRPRRLRLGWPKQYFFERVDPEVHKLVEAAAKRFQDLGGRLEEVSLPHLHDCIDPITNIALAEAARYHESQGYFPSRANEYGEDVSSRLALGREVRAVDYLAAFDVLRIVTQDFDGAFERVDAILAPTLPVTAPLIGEKEIQIGGESETVRSALVRLNRPANGTGHPAISIPCGFTRAGLPVGLQIIAPRWCESRLLAIALAYEEATEWRRKRPLLN